MTAPTPDQAAAQIKPLIQAGAALANIAFNLSQRAGQPITAAWASSMRDAYEAWDALPRARLVDKMADLQRQLVDKIAELQDSEAARRELLARQVPEWMPIETAPKDGTEIWIFNGQDVNRGQGLMTWLDHPEYQGWIWADELEADSDPIPVQPTHWMLPIVAPTATGAGEATQWAKPDRAPGEDGFTYG